MRLAALRAGLARDLSALWPALLAARVAVLAGWVAAGLLRGGTEPTVRLRAEGLIAWDGTWYRDIAVFGYDAVPVEALRFFPAYPLLVRALSWPFGGGQGTVSWVLIVVANLAAVVAAILVRRLVLAERGDERLANASAVALTLFPTGFVLVWAYSEALFLVAAVGFFLAVRRSRWWWATPLGILAGATRPLGIFLVPVAAIELVRCWRTSTAAQRALGAVGVVSPLLGTAGWLIWTQSRTGEWLYPFTSQSDLRGETVNPLVRLVQGVGELFGPEVLGDGLHLPFAAAFVALVVVVFRRWPVSYGVFALLVLLSALAADNLNSLERYALNAFPVALAVAGLCTSLWRTRLALGVGLAGIVSLSALAWMGTYVP
jgi:hypothetical protein